VVEVNTKLLPDQLLKVTQAIEEELGRVRKEHWGPRLIDIDVLFYGDHIINLPDLTIPHVAIPERRFTLVPMNELAPEWVHPALHTTIEQLLARCEDMLEVKKWG
ncbi:MAG TPA: 2-amino-4-hydroxy-6-hydroxymethyldihydropteridine diphosphokinase, partial [Cyclobacteriaceae bacterium]|nr:2-amino-4-hydroxy-6-hydroxymethyldihydropteridine diphosphokinase [Cyclobacteriaceae bacterium]